MERFEDPALPLRAFDVGIGHSAPCKSVVASGPVAHVLRGDHVPEVVVGLAEADQFADDIGQRVGVDAGPGQGVWARVLCRTRALTGWRSAW